jgi:hypothetical protein
VQANLTQFAAQSTHRPDDFEYTHNILGTVRVPDEIVKGGLAVSFEIRRLETRNWRLETEMNR